MNRFFYKFYNFSLFNRLYLPFLVGSLTWGISFSASGLDLAQEPLFLAQSARPVVMFAMSRDHELYLKAYNDYTNLDGGATSMRDTTYRNDFSYYGYFDSNWCYTYRNNRFEPENNATNHQCGTSSSGRWSGNFLNWASMTRIDILRQVLYGGKRRSDTAKTDNADALTVLERAYLTKDSHAFAKVYDPDSEGNASGAVSLYTPYDQDAISFCNISVLSNDVYIPVIRVARGTWYNWANTEVVQCEWDADRTNPNYNSADKHSLGTFHARVSVCEHDKDGPASPRCYEYQEDAFKPIGLLQRNYKEIDFGLVTGTWDNRRKGGVLRKKAGRLAGNTGTGVINEFSESTGVFNTDVVGLIGNIDKFQISGDTGNNRSSRVDWGNPVGEIYAEALRYLAGTKSPTSGFADGGGPTGITSVTKWDDPLSAAVDCTNCSVIILSSGPNSWDGDDITDGIVGSIVDGLDKEDLDENYTDKIGVLEFGSSQKYFQGGTSLASQCSITTLSGLSQVSGLCPQEPMMQGTYAVSGLSYMARTNSIRSDEDDRHVSTYAVELSQGLPNLSIPVGNGTISIVPVCTASGNGNPCSLVAVRVEDILLDNEDNPVKGSYLFFWEDNNQHASSNDYDMDSVQRIEFCVGSNCDDFLDANHYREDDTYKEHEEKISTSINANQMQIVNSIPYWATGAQMSLSYIVSGTNVDGLQDEWVKRGGYDAHNLVDENGNAIDSSVSIGPSYWYNTIPPEGADYLPRDVDSNRVYLQAKTFSIGTTNTNQLESPLFYAAKYGNFVDLDADGRPNGWDLKNNVTGAPVPDGIPDAYFSVNNPAALEENLKAVFDNIKAQNASGAAATTNAASLDNGTVIYQALFNSPAWDGELRAMNVESSGALGTQKWTTRSETAFPSNLADRNIVTHNGTSALDFTVANWENLSAAQRAALGTETQGKNIIRWMRGERVTTLRDRPNVDLSSSNESSRDNLLGDIVNSSPVFAGKNSQRFETLPEDLGGDEYEAYVTEKKSRVEVIYVGANDGMIHAFNADNGQELFAYVPSMVYGKLAAVSSPSYGISTPHQYIVDGPLQVSDVYYGGNWKTILVGSLGAGGKGFFALDVTDPTTFGPSDVLFELTADDYPELGNVMGTPYIAPVGDRWKLIFGNGYNSVGTRAHLFVIDLQYPKNTAYSKILAAGTTSDNGLATPALLPGATGSIVAVYAGDLFGNMWKFDLSGTASTWGAAFGGLPLFTAAYDDATPSTRQSITAAPTLGLKNASAGGGDAIMVYFGTGKYLEKSDITDLSVQSFYAIADSGARVTIAGGRDTKLHEKSIQNETETTRTVGDKDTMVVDWANKEGWFIDLIPPFPSAAQGERVVSKPLLRYDRVLFPTLIPSDDSCSFGGSGWTMELAGVGDKYPGYSMLGDDGKRNENFSTGLTTAVGDDKIVIVSSDIKGDVDTIAADKPVGALDSGRMSWRQLR